MKPLKINNRRRNNCIYIPDEIAKTIGVGGCVFVSPVKYESLDAVIYKDSMIIEPVSIKYKIGTSVATVKKCNFIRRVISGYKSYIDMKNVVPETQAIMFQLGINPLLKKCYVVSETFMLPAHGTREQKGEMHKCFIIKKAL